MGNRPPDVEENPVSQYRQRLGGKARSCRLIMSISVNNSKLVVLTFLWSLLFCPLNFPIATFTTLHLFLQCKFTFRSILSLTHLPLTCSTSSSTPSAHLLSGFPFHQVPRTSTIYILSSPTLIILECSSQLFSTSSFCSHIFLSLISMLLISSLNYFFTTQKYKTLKGLRWSRAY